MKWCNKGHELDGLAERLCSTTAKFYIWGTANIAENLYALCGNEIQIVGAVDSDAKKQGTLFHGIAIESPDVLQNKEDYIVLVTTSAWNEVKKALQRKGFVENRDFFDYFVFYQIYQMYAHGKLYSRRLDISLTERCTLKCKKCNMFMPYFHNPGDLEAADVIEQIKHYFSLVDYLESFNLLGGEPLLYPALSEIIAFVGENYRSQIEHFKIFTNGMLLPGEELLDCCKRYDVEIQISDYTCTVPYEKRIQELTDMLNQKGIAYYILKSSEWGDFGFPENRNTITENELIPYFEACKAGFRGLYRDRVYFCHLETSAIRAGLYEDNSNDYYALGEVSAETKKHFLEFDFGYSELGAITFCKECRGCAPQNKLTVPAAEQF